MKRKPYSRRKRTSTKSVLRLPDLEHARAAVLNSLTSLYGSVRGVPGNWYPYRDRRRTSETTSSLSVREPFHLWIHSWRWSIGSSDALVRG